MGQHADIAIIGAGFSGAMLAARLTNSGQRVILIDDSDAIACGAAYSTPWPEHLLNVPAIRMGAVTDAVDGFYAWVEGSGKDCAMAYGVTFPVAADSFLPRALYGDYLRTLVTPALPSITHIKARVTDISLSGHGYRMCFAEGEDVHAARIVLAMGNGFASSANAAYHYVEPWRCDFDRVAHENYTDPIIIIGTGLTAVDTLISLLSRNVSTPIHVISRHGKFPAPHSATPLATPPSFDASALKGAALSQAMRIIRRFIAQAMGQGHTWQSAIDALRPHTITTWHGLSDLDKQRFFKRLFSPWNRVRHRMAPHLHAILTDAFGTRYSVTCADVVSITEHTVTCSDGTSLRGSLIFDCRGPRYHPARDSLLSSLIREGIVSPHRNGMGLKVYDSAYRVSSPAFPTIYAIGPLLLGEHLETTAVPELRLQVHAIAELLSTSSGSPHVS